jgi:hypothetical protein
MIDQIVVYDQIGVFTKIVIFTSPHHERCNLYLYDFISIHVIMNEISNSSKIVQNGTISQI